MRPSREDLPTYLPCITEVFHLARDGRGRVLCLVNYLALYPCCRFVYVYRSNLVATRYALDLTGSEGTSLVTSVRDVMDEAFSFGYLFIFRTLLTLLWVCARACASPSIETDLTFFIPGLFVCKLLQT